MNIALILSGGVGSRLASDIPKQYIKVNDKPILCYCVETVSKSRSIDRIQIVADGKWQAQIREWLETADTEKKFCGFSAPGWNRQLSILNGLEDIKKYAADTDYVFIHDAARPRLSERQTADCLAAAQGHDGVIPALPMKDTLYASGDGRTITSLLDRGRIYAGQAPEAFRIGPYYEANQALLPEKIRKINGSTEPAVLAGLDIVMIPGDEDNYKITTYADLERFRRECEAGPEKKG